MHTYTDYFSHVHLHSFIEVRHYCGKGQSVLPQTKKDSSSI